MIHITSISIAIILRFKILKLGFMLCRFVIFAQNQIQFEIWCLWICIPNGEHWTAMAIHSHFSKKSEPSKKFHQFSSSNHIRIDRTRTPHSQRAKGVEGRFDRSVLYSAQNMRERGTKRNITGSKHTEKISLMLLPTTKENVMSLFIDRLLSCKSRACLDFSEGWLNSEL